MDKFENLQTNNENKQYYIPMEVSAKTIKDFCINPADVVWTRIGNKPKKVIMIPVSEEQYKAYMRPLWREDKRQQRQEPMASLDKMYEETEYEAADTSDYTKDADKNLVIVSEEAEIIKRIYREYLEGANYKEISAGLESDGILTAAGNPRWHTSTLKKILTNEKYMGDALLQKTYTVDCLTKKRVANDGTVPQYYVNNNHEAIIPRELFARVQEEMKRRTNIRQGMDGKRRVYSSKYALSSIVFCGHCGGMYRRTHWNNHGKKQIVWRCVTRLNAPGVECPARTLSEVQLQNLVLEAINKVLGGKQRAIKVLETNISEVVGNAHIEELERIKQQIEKQQILLVKMTAASEDYSKVVDKIYALQKEQEEAMAANVNYKAGKERIQEMIEYLKSQPKRVTVYDEQLVRKLIEKITVYDDHLDFLFKSEIQIDIKG